MCLVDWILRRRKKKMRENDEGKHFEGCLVDRRRGKNDNGALIFSP